MGRPQGKIPLGRPRRRWEDNIRMDLQEILWGWTGLIWLRIGTSGGISRALYGNFGFHKHELFLY
jgi:hypothetical protein